MPHFLTVVATLLAITAVVCFFLEQIALVLLFFSVGWILFELTPKRRQRQH